MAMEIHAQRLRQCFLFREWSTNSDSYATPSLSGEEFTLYRVSETLIHYVPRFGVLLDFANDTAESLLRAIATGSNIPGYERSLDQWTENSGDNDDRTRADLVHGTRSRLLEPYFRNSDDADEARRALYGERYPGIALYGPSKAQVLAQMLDACEGVQIPGHKPQHYKDLSELLKREFSR
ncbi:hypothetical protein HYV86_04550 [Candidatus Woesearchaeota archaeon]|nr:hypothetical protein [Candidatus Woesearchaeota archaeon]